MKGATMPANYPDWIKGKTPHTHSKAHATGLRRVDQPCLAIRVSGATYRGSLPIDGVFELVADAWVKDEPRYEVFCSWFGVKPFTCYPRIKAAACEPLHNYTVT
jgi:hypothetical protein